MNESIFQYQGWAIPNHPIENHLFRVHNIPRGERMLVPEMMVVRAWDKAGGRCECSRWSHSHTYVQCTRLLKWEMREKGMPGGWAPRFHTSFSSGEPLGCEILCMSCYQKDQAAELGRL